MYAVLTCRIGVLLVLLLSAAASSQAGCQEEGPEGGSGCCLCPSGFYLAEPCRDGVNATCAPCGPGTFTSSPNSNNTCNPCSDCPQEGVHVLQQCNATRDTVCRCDLGMYLDGGDGRCKPCDLCGHGWGVARQCSAVQNTLCRKCPPGTYSGVLSGTLGCLLCTTCREDQVMLQECSRIQDTLCVDKNQHRWHHFPTTLPRQRQSEDANEVITYTESSVVPVYCTIMVAVGLGLIAYLVLRWRLQTPNKSSRLETVIMSEGCDTPFLGNRLLSEIGCKMKSPDFKPTLVNSKIRISDVCSIKRRELELALNNLRQDGKDWRGLAKELGYSNSSICAFEHLGRERYGPMCYLLADWSKSDNATVEFLMQALLHMGRIDMMRVLQSSCERIYPPLRSCQTV